MTRGQCVGSLDLLRRSPMVFDDQLLHQAYAGAEAAAKALLEASLRVLAEGVSPPWEPAEVIGAHWGSAHRASGLLAGRWGITPDDALDWLRARAIASQMSLPQVVAAVLDGSEALEDGGDGLPR